MHKDDLLKISMAYWCNWVVGEANEQYWWAYERVNDEIAKSDVRAVYKLLTALALTAPDDQALAYFSAGPLEDYVNRILNNSMRDEARLITESPQLKKAMQHVWADLEGLRKLAEGGRENSSLKPFIKELSISFPDLAGYWCSVNSSKISPAYNKNKDAVLRLLQTKPKEIGDILVASAPDEQAEEYLKVHVLHKHFE